MQITFAIPQTVGDVDYDAGAVADIPDVKARELIRDGYARAGADKPTRKGRRSSTPPPEPPEQVGPPVPARNAATQDWVDYASANKVPVPEGTTRKSIIAMLDERGVLTGKPADTEPDEGDTGEVE